MNNLFYLVPAAAVVALVFAYIFFRQMMKESEGTVTMKQIAQFVREGAMAYLKQQYKVVIIVFIVLAALFAVLAFLGVQNSWVPFAFLTGGFFSGLAGFVGMKTATYASARTANAAQRSLNSGLKVAFRSGAVMGLTVVGLGLLDIAIWWVILNQFVDIEGTQKLVFITTTMLTFGMGASTQALFARVGGGIYTKAADVGADLVGKVEAGIPEDDPRNPATIADNVGDNVGDVAGMGADLYESYCGSILATMALGAAAYSAVSVEAQMKAILAPMTIAAIGVVLSIIGIYVVRTKEGAGMDQLLKSLGRGTNLSSILIAGATFGIMYMLGMENWWGFSLSVVVGLLAGVIIGQATEYYTSHSYRPTQKLAESAETGPATVIISGVGLGMLSTAIPVVTIAVAILLAYLCANGFDLSFSADSLSTGLYGIGIAAVGMLSTTGIVIAVDAYGPISDNAGGIAEMSELPEEVREITDTLDSVGNTTAAVGKGFAVGSAALTALALFVSYSQIANLDKIDLLTPTVVAGLLIGGMLPMLFSALTMNSVGKAANQMIEEVRRQFREIPGVMEGTAKPDYARCVDISTGAALKEMVIPGLLAILAPLVVGIVLGVEALGGLLAGALAAGVLLALMMANAGGAWDNAKKYIEEGYYGGKGSEPHKAAVVGDTVGDPFKDTSGPSINILIKLMTIVAVVFAPLFVQIGGLL